MHRGRTLLVALAAVMLALTPLLYVVYDSGRLNQFLPDFFKKQYDFSLETYFGEYVLSGNDAGVAVLEATEIITIDYYAENTKNGIFLILPNEVQGIDIQTSIISVTENGDPVEYEVFRAGESLELSIGEIGSAKEVLPSRGMTTYEIRYQASDVVSFDPSTGEQFFGWNLISANWPAAFEGFNANVFLEGSDQKVQLLQNLIQRGVAVDFRVDLPANIFKLQQNLELQATHYWLLILNRVLLWLPVLLLTGFLVFAAFWRIFTWRNHKVKDFVVTEYEPPEGVEPFIAAILLNRSKTAWIAQVLFLVLQNQILMFEEQGPRGHKKLVLKRNPLAPVALSDLQQGALNALFASDDVLELQNIDKNVKARLGSHTQRVLLELDARGLRSLAGTQFGISVVVINLLATVSFFVAVLLKDFLGSVRSAGVSEEQMFFIPIFIVLLNAIIFVVIRKPALLLPDGAKLVHKLEGLRRYMSLAEADRISFLQGVTGAPRVGTDAADAKMLLLNERLLPYAVIWGMENEWQSELARSVRQLQEFDFETPERGLVLFHLSINLLKK